MIDQILKEIEQLKKRIDEARTDLEAIELQQQLSQLLIRTLEDPEVIKELALRNRNIKWN